MAKLALNISEESMRRCLLQLRELESKQLRAANKSAVRAVMAKIQREVRKMVVADYPGAKRVARRWPDTVPMAKGGTIRVSKDGMSATFGARKPFYLAYFVTGTGARRTKGNYARSTIGRKVRGRHYDEGINRGRLKTGNYVERAQKAIEPQLPQLLDELLMKQIERQWRKANK
jgi:hypothetical protein